MTQAFGKSKTQRVWQRARPALIILAVAIAAGAAIQLRPSIAAEGRAIPAPASDEATRPASEVAVLAGGCFWGVQGVFQHVTG
ncbi:MAG: hypothetical protein ABI612_20575, partial [Betaproteobacteria bacterium]